MLALIGAGRTRLDPGSVGLALARRWAAAGDGVLFIDGDTTGSRLAERLGAAEASDFSPAARGMPTLIVARQQLTLRLIADHCYSLEGSDSSLWALFAPFSPDGGKLAARWLADHSGDIKMIDRERSIILSSRLAAANEHLTPLLNDAQVVVVLASIRSTNDARRLRTSSQQAGLMRFERTHRLLILEGACPLSEDEIHLESGFRVAGRLPLLEDERVLRTQGGRRERAFAGVLDEVAARSSALLALYAAHGGAGETDGSRLDPHLPDLNGSLEEAAVNGSAIGSATVPDRPPELSPQGSV